jgi:sugar phosphate isomerase/epimerase
VREVLDRAGHPRCGILLDTYHFHRSGGDAESLGRARPEEIIYVHYSDVPAHGVERGKVVDRLPPGQGVVRFGEILRWLAGGYIGYLSYEAPNQLSWERNPESVAREALDASRTMLANLSLAS